MGVKRLAQDLAELATEKEPRISRFSTQHSGAHFQVSRLILGTASCCGTGDEIEPRFGALSVRPGDGEADGGFEHRRYYFLSRKRHEAGTNAFKNQNDNSAVSFLHY